MIYLVISTLTLYTLYRLAKEAGTRYSVSLYSYLYISVSVLVSAVHYRILTTNRIGGFLFDDSIIMEISSLLFFILTVVLPIYWLKHQITVNKKK